MASFNRRQPSRTARTTATRPTNYYARSFGSATLIEEPAAEEAQSGFFPAITHFTDAVDALPREVMRHYSLMREVEAKLSAPDEELAKLATQIGKLPRNTAQSANIPAATDSDLKPTASETEAAKSSTTPESKDNERANLFRNLMMRVAHMGPILDEKIAVLSNTNLTLAAQLERMQSSYDHIPEEISDVTRLGSTTHWAYVTEKEPKKTGPERARREAAAANVYAGGSLQELDPTTARSESRREAMLARKIRKEQHQDSDFEERPASRKQNKGKKQQAEAEARGPGPANGATAGAKRKKPGGTPLAGTFTVTKNRVESPATGVEVPKKRKNPPGPLPGRKKAATNDARSSPRIPFSSPILGSFPSKDTGRAGHARGRHGGSQASNAQAVDRARASSAAIGIPINGGTAMEVDPASPLAHMPDSSSTSLNKPTSNEITATRPAPERSVASETVQSELGVNNDDIPAPQQLLTTRTGRVSKAATPISATFPDSVPKPTARSRAKDNGNSGSGANDDNANSNGSHVSSEVASNAGSVAPSRMSTREKRRPRRDGSPGSSIAGSNAAPEVSVAAEVEDDTEKKVDPIAAEDAESAPAPKARTPHSSPPLKNNKEPELEPDNDELEDELEEPDADDEDEEEPTYCYCNGVSYGSMVACDNEECPRQWFHLKCAGLKQAPAEEETWFCDNCKELGFGRKTKGSGRRGKKE